MMVIRQILEGNLYRGFFPGSLHHCIVVRTQTEVKPYIDGNIKTNIAINIANLKNSGFSLFVGAKNIRIIMMLITSS